MENLTGGTPPVRYLPCVVPCKLYFSSHKTKTLVALAGYVSAVAMLDVLTKTHVIITAIATAKKDRLTFIIVHPFI